MNDVFQCIPRFLLDTVGLWMIAALIAAVLTWRKHQQLKQNTPPLECYILWITTILFFLLHMLFGMAAYFYYNAILYDSLDHNYILSFAGCVFDVQSNTEVTNYTGISIFYMLFSIVLLSLVTKTLDEEMTEETGWHILIGLMIIFVGVMVAPAFVGKFFGTLLGTYSTSDASSKYKTLEFIALIMGGVLAILGATTINRRANAQEENNMLHEKNNYLKEKRREDNRFQNLISGLGDKKTGVRIATFYRFYYLALKTRGENNGKFEKDVFEILYSYFRAMSSGIPDIQMPDDTKIECATSKSASLKAKYEYQTESQILFDILFKGRFKSPRKKMSDSREGSLIDDDFNVNLQNVRIVNINFSNANLSNVDFRGAQFKDVNLKEVDCVDGANFCGAEADGKKIHQGYFPGGLGKYYTDDNPSPDPKIEM